MRRQFALLAALGLSMLLGTGCSQDTAVSSPDGGLTLRFSPRYPKNALQLSTPELALRDTQREMYALNLKPEQFKTSIDDAV